MAQSLAYGKNYKHLLKEERKQKREKWKDGGGERGRQERSFLVYFLGYILKNREIQMFYAGK